MKKPMTIRRKKIECYALSFIIPVIFMLIISIAYGFYPFGKTSILMADMRYQFVDYYGYLKSIFFGNNDFFYNFSKTFGGDMYGFSAYYLNSLPNLFLLLFPNEYLPAGILFMGILLIGASGLTFNIMINNLYSVRRASLIFSTAYSFMGFFLAYFNCTHYFFNLMLLPLVILGLCRMVDSGKISVLYVVTLFLSIFSNYYIGYMTCLFTVIFFLYYVLSKVERMKDLSSYVNSLFSYIIGSIIAGAMSAFVLLPVLYSLVGQKSGVSEANLSLSRTFYMSDVFSGLYTTAFHGNISDGLPIIYCGVCTVVFVILYLVNKKVSVKERIVSVLALLAVLCCFYINALNIVWHGFNEPIGFPYRDSFFFSFLMIYIAYKGFISTAGDLKPYQGVICVLIFLIYSAYLLISQNEYVGRDQVVLTGCIILVLLFFLYGFRNKKEYVIPLTVGLFLLQSVDLLYNGYVSIGGYFQDIEENQEDYRFDNFYNFVADNTALLDEIKAKDSDFYRIEKFYRRSNNDAMLLNYNGLSHFSSCETEQVKNFMESLGFRNNENWAFYGVGSTSFADSFMGVKYLMSQYDSIARPYDYFIDDGERYVFKSPYALSLMFNMKDSAKSISPGKYNRFSYQNAIAGAFTNDKYKIYRPVYQSDVELVNVEQEGNEYKIIDKGQEAYISYNLIANCNDFIFMYFYGPQLQDTTIVINDLEKEPYFTRYGWSVREVGYYDRGEEIKVKVYLNQDSIKIDKALFYYENYDELDRWYSDVKDNQGTLKKITSSHLQGNINCKDGDIVVLTIPYENGWKIKVDGKEVKQFKVLNGLLAFDAGTGNHIIDMKYIPQGLKAGSIVSLLAFIILIGICIYNKKKRNNITTR